PAEAVRKPTRRHLHERVTDEQRGAEGAEVFGIDADVRADRFLDGVQSRALDVRNDRDSAQKCEDKITHGIRSAGGSPARPKCAGEPPTPTGIYLSAACNRVNSRSTSAAVSASRSHECGRRR